MSKKYRNLMPKIADIGNLRRAYKSTQRGRRMTLGALSFKEHAEVNLKHLQEQLESGEWKPDIPRSFWIYEPKPRLITAQSFRDRVVHHALCNVIGPIFENSLLPRTYACREGKGTHAAARRVQADMRRMDGGFALKTDFSKFFPSVDHVALHAMIEQKITCRATLNLIARIVPMEGVGLPIGALTSQLFANVYAGAVDRLLSQCLGEKRWVRYMDDIVVLGMDNERLRHVKIEIERFAANKLHLHFSKWSIQPISRGVNFVGYRIWPHYKLLRRQSVVSARRKLRHYIETGDALGKQQFLGSWLGHAAHADSHNLLVGLGLKGSEYATHHQYAR